MTKPTKPVLPPVLNKTKSINKNSSDKNEPQQIQNPESQEKNQADVQVVVGEDGLPQNVVVGEDGLPQNVVVDKMDDESEVEYDFGELTFDTYTPDIAKVENSMSLIMPENLTEEERQLLVKKFKIGFVVKDEKYYITASYPQMNPKTLSPSEKRIIKSIELGFTICHRDFEKDEETWNIAKNFITFLSESFGIDLGINTEIKKGYNEFKKKVEIPRPVNVISVLSNVEPTLHCTECLEKCRTKPQKKVGKSTMVEKAEFCDRHKKEIEWKLKIIGAFIIGVMEKDKLEPEFKKFYGEHAERQYELFTKFADLAKKCLEYSIKQRLQASEKADRSFITTMRNCVENDSFVLAMPAALSYNANHEGKFTRLILELLQPNTDIYRANFLMREVFFFENSSNRWTNAPRNLNQKSNEGEKVSLFYGGQLPVLFIEFLISGIVLFGMAVGQRNVEEPVLASENSFFNF